MLAPLLVFVLVLMLVAPAAIAQLTQEDIDAMRERGKQEGWTFEVRLSEVNSKYPLEQMCGFKKPDNWYDLAEHTVFTATQAIPSSWDWRQMDGVTPIKNQLTCGSCWAFATVGPIESSIRIRDAQTVDLAEQWLVSCNRELPLKWGCDGGWFAFDYFIRKKDLCSQYGGVLEKYFPYAAADLPCSGCPYTRDHYIDAWYYIGDGISIPPIDQIKQAIMEFGPVGVGVFVTDPWYGYGGGIYNNCISATETNHAVTVVGWDDDFQGSGQGVWIVKNSWGKDWGDDGYMYIVYDCNLIGYAAAYIENGLPGVFFWADTTYGPAPLDVNFDAFSPLTVDTWTWDLGDGDSAFVQTPATHTYTERGAYDVTLQIDAGGDIRTVTKPYYIVAIADTMLGDTVATESPQEDLEMVLIANNSAPVAYIAIPVEYDNPYGITFDSFSTVGCRTDYFEIQEYLHYDPWGGKRVTLKLMSSTAGTSPDLVPGEGPVAKLYFNVPAGLSSGDAVTIFLDGYLDYVPYFGGPVISYEIPYVNGYIHMPSGGCCEIRGDFNHDGYMNPLDAAEFVDWLWRGGPGPVCPEEADVDGSGGVDPLDASYIVAYFWGGGPAPVPCP